ncbi:MAG: type III pantothenate kinase [Leptospirillia bacterium]
MSDPMIAGRLSGVTVKVGLSRISVALHGVGEILAIRTTGTPDRGEGETLREFFTSLWPALDLHDLPGALVSVVPDLTPVLDRFWRLRFARPLRVFDLSRAPFSSGDYLSGALGVDRGAAIWGAVARHETRVGQSFMVADFGTHTVTTVLCRGRILGGTIMPGVGLTIGAVGGGRVLQEQRECPRKGVISPGECRGLRAVARGTREGILSGAVLGSVAAVEGLRNRAEREMDEPLGLVLTGGLSPLLARFFSGTPPVDRQLLHHGARCFLLA